jgi:hypothetical protein
MWGLPVAGVDAAVVAAVVAPVLTAAIGAFSAWQVSAWKYHREAADKATVTLQQNRDPLLRAIFDLQSRLYNIAAKEFFARYWSRDDDEQRRYARVSTLWLFGQYLGRTEILRREVQYLDLGSRATNREVQRRLNDVSSALASDAIGRENTFILYRSDQRAVGEFMVIARDTEGGKRPDCLGYSEFIEAFAGLERRAAEGQPEAQESPVLDWARRFTTEIELIADAELSIGLQKRLVRVQRRLINLLDLLDPERLRYPNPDLRGKLPWPGEEEKPLARQVARFVWPWEEPWSGVEEWADARRLRCTSTTDTVRCYRGARGPLGGRPEFQLAFEGEAFKFCAWTAAVGRSRRIDGSLRSSRARLALDDLLDRYDRPLVIEETRPFRAARWVRRRLVVPPGVG